MVEFLDQWFARSFYTMGGGTILAGRWKHRYSTDIDLFFDEDQISKLQNPTTWEQISSKLAVLSDTNEITDLHVRPNGFAFENRFGPVSFFGVSRISRNAVTSELENSTCIATESTTEILVKKVRGRMINNSTYVARDLYDVVVAYFKDRESLDEVFGMLAEVERQSLVYDVQKGDAAVSDLERILEPAYSSLVESFDTFNEIAGEVLSRNVSESGKKLLEDLTPT